MPRPRPGTASRDGVVLIEAAIAASGMSDVEFARVLDVNPRTLRSYTAAALPVRGAIGRLARAVLRDPSLAAYLLRLDVGEHPADAEP